MASVVMERSQVPGMIEALASAGTVIVHCAVVGCDLPLPVPRNAVTRDGGVSPNCRWGWSGKALASDKYWYCSDNHRDMYAGDD